MTAAADYFAADDWRQRAACRGMDPDLFFPGRGDDAREAKAVCATCCVVEQCLDYAVGAGIRMGIWGATSERERRRLRRDRAA